MPISEERQTVNELISRERNVRRNYVRLTVWYPQKNHIPSLWFHGHVLFRVVSVWWQPSRYEKKLIWGYEMEEAFPFGLPF